MSAQVLPRSIAAQGFAPAAPVSAINGIMLVALQGLFVAPDQADAVKFRGFMVNMGAMMGMR